LQKKKRYSSNKKGEQSAGSPNEYGELGGKYRDLRGNSPTFVVYSNKVLIYRTTSFLTFENSAKKAIVSQK
jgi:hypothetical protein